MLLVVVTADFERDVRAVLVERCGKCHTGAGAKGEVDVAKFSSSATAVQQPRDVQRMIEALEAGDMPPEDEPPLTPAVRTQLVAALKDVLRMAAARESRRLPLHRLNRYQYNFAVKDLLQLNRNVFELPEKLVTRRDRYIPLAGERMPDVVHADSQALQPQPGLQNVKAFPKDLRAEHGFDNQATKLTLSPLLLDAYLRLAASIVESPDFSEANVGMWPTLLVPPPPGAEASAELPRRLAPFLRRAFRGPVDDETLQRYVAYTSKKLDQGVAFPEAMKKTVAAVLSSPRFLYRAESESEDPRDAAFASASRLSFFLWSSGPDDQLLDAAERGDLRDPQKAAAEVDRMLADPKIERFLDAFPTQWLQLENALAATPDPKRSRYFRLDENHPASLQMVVEPLLLFDAVFLENRPLVELIAPSFTYRSDFLNDWYTSSLEPPPFDAAAVVAENERRELQRQAFELQVRLATEELTALVSPVRRRMEEEKTRASAPDKARGVDLKPYAAWDFNGDLKDAAGSLHLAPHGEVQFDRGCVVLKKAYLQSPPLEFDLRAKTLEVWCRLSNLDQPGGGLMTLQGPGDFFDSIVIGERKPRHWISGSNGFARTDDFGDSQPESVVDQPLHLAMVYALDGTTMLYRNGEPYGKPFRKSSATFPRGQSSVLFGLRHLPAIGNRFLEVQIDKARLYDRALTSEEVQASASGAGFFVTEDELLAAMEASVRERYRKTTAELTSAKLRLAQTPPADDVEKLRREHRLRYEDLLRRKFRSTEFRRVALEDARYGGVITNAAVLSMTSGPQRTQPIARGAWIIESIFNDPPPPPPNDVPPLKEEDDSHLTIRERFAAHRENPSCAGCHARIDPLGFALENYDITGRWRDKYENGKPVDASGVWARRDAFSGPVEFKSLLVRERERFARAFTSHLLRYAVSRELTAADQLAIDAVLERTMAEEFRLRTLIRETALSGRL
ncbi:MAG: DUF1588 domain-containing protein [Pirellulales bacterium]